MLNLLTYIKDFSWLIAFLLAAIVSHCAVLKCNEYRAQRDAAISDKQMFQVLIDQQNTAFDNLKRTSEEANKKQRQQEQTALVNMQKATKDVAIRYLGVPTDSESLRLWGINKALELKWP